MRSFITSRIFQAVLLLVAGTASSFAQDMLGTAYPSKGTSVTYNAVFDDGTTFTSAPNWVVTNGSVTSSSWSTYQATATISWPNGGPGSISLKKGITVVSSKTIMVLNGACTSGNLPAAPVGETTAWHASGETALLHLTPGAPGNTIMWCNSTLFNDTYPNRIDQGTYFTTQASSAPFTYHARSLNTTNGCYSATQSVDVLILDPVSSVKEEVVRVSGKTPTDLATLTTDQKSTAIAYRDGLGRVNQTVALQASQGGKDIVQPVDYDAFGRVSKSYLPYTVTSTTPGSFRGSYANEMLQFYEATGDKIADDTKPYATAAYESSPLGRPTEQGAFGAATQAGSGHTQTYTYGYNADSEVRMLNQDGSSSQYYPANTLRKTTVTDADSKDQIVFTDRFGRTILTKRRLEEVIDNSNVSYLETYYVYNEKGQLTLIISPKGVALLKTTWAMTSDIRNNYSHQFVYGKYGRLIEKKVPGQDWMYYVYDNLGRLVLVQDGMTRNDNSWLFIKYDRFDRPVMSGLYKNNTSVTRASVQAILDAVYVSGNSTYPDGSHFEQRGTAQHGYTDTSFPKANEGTSPTQILAVSYYDNYDFDFNGSDDYAYTTVSGLTGQHTQASASFLPTGGKRLVLGTSTWLTSYVFYDDRQRAIQARSNNHLRPNDLDNLVTVVYDFEGKVLNTKNEHNAGTAVTVYNRYTYDAKGRLLKIYQQNNAAAEQLVAQYEYNELGQMVDKKLHNTTGTNFLQSVDFRYTINGQLQSINNAQLDVNSATNDESNDYFGMEMLYNTAESGLGNTAYYNGNISAIKWKGIGQASGNTGTRSYIYTYDKSNQLKNAVSKVRSSLWDKETNALNESMTYDHNGNIKTLQRNQRKHGLSGVIASFTSEAIDDLTYIYNSSNVNTLEKVTDAATATGGFSNGASGTNNDYTYDVNGNLLTDTNKDISGIIYNFLGKPTQITFTSGKVISYTYDAGGAKLKMAVTQSGTTNTTDYVGGFVYENSNLSFFGAPEGRVVKNGSNYEHQYAIADNQGNTRVVFTSATPAPEATPVVHFETSTNSDVDNYTNRVNWELMDHTDATTDATDYSQKLFTSSTGRIGVAKLYKVYPGDKVKIEAYAKYYNLTSTGTSLAGFATSLLSAFNLPAPAPGETGTPSSALNTWGGYVEGGNSHGTSSYPMAFVNLIVLDKNNNFLDGAWNQINGGEQVGIATKAAHDYMMQEYTAKEEGWIYVYTSNENATSVEVYFDDVVITRTKSNVIQYNEYYPFGLQTASSWTRENSVKNDYLYNEGNELNSVTGWYETMFRGYDPAIGRFQQIDPLAVLDHSRSPYGYGRNNPVLYNDPLGLLVNPGFPNATWNIIEKLWNGTPDDGIGYWSDNQYHYFNGGGEVPGPGSNYQPGTAGGSIRPVFDIKEAWEYVAAARGAGDEESVPDPPIGFEFYPAQQVTQSALDSFNDAGALGSNNDPLSGQNDRSLVGHGGASKNAFPEPPKNKIGENAPDSKFTPRGGGTHWLWLFDEFKSGEGPEYSIFYEGHPMVEDLKNSYIILLAKFEFGMRGGAMMVKEDIPFGILGAVMSKTMTEQFIGGARVSIIPTEEGNLFVVDNSTGRYSYRLHAQPDIPRISGVLTPEGTTYQRFTWLEKK